jgi:titin
MKRAAVLSTILIVAVLALGAAAPRAPGAPASSGLRGATCTEPTVAHSSSTGEPSYSVSTTSISTSLTVVAGDTLLVAGYTVGGGADTDTLSVSDGTNSFASRMTAANVTTPLVYWSSEVWTATVATSGTDTVTVSQSESVPQWETVAAFDISGSTGLTAGPFSTTLDNTVNVLSPSVPAPACSTLVATYLSYQWGTSTTPAGWNVLTWTTNGGGQQGFDGYSETEATAGTHSAALSFSAGNETSYTSVQGEIAAFTSSAGSPIVPPAPTDLVAYPLTDSEIEVSWTNPSEGSGYALTDNHVYLYSAGCASLLSTYSANAVVTSYDEGGLTPNTGYCVSVSATNANGTSDHATPYVNTSTYFAPPSPPTRLGAAAGSPSTIGISWTAPTSSGILANYTARLGTVNGTWTRYVWAIDGLSLAYTVPSLLPSTTYYLELEAWTNGGNSTWTAAAHAQTLATPVYPTAPTDLAVLQLNTTALVLSWVAPTNVAPVNYTVAYGLSTGNYTLFVNAAGNATEVVLENLTPGTQYFVTVWAWSPSGPGPAAAEANNTTLASSGLGGILGALLGFTFSWALLWISLAVVVSFIAILALIGWALGGSGRSGRGPENRGGSSDGG